MKTHQKYGTRAYWAWANMKSRCFNPNNIRFHRYGERGITVCDRWMSFESFYADMGDCPPGMTLDRIDNDGNYEPGNCRWATVREQSQKTSRIRFLTFNGETLSLAEWARRLGIRANTLTMRLNTYGWPLEKALTKKGA